MRAVFSREPEGLPDPGSYPTGDWGDQRAKYWEYWRLFDGDWLDNTVSDTDETLKYPLKLNPFNMACLLHAGFLFGEVQDSNEPLVTTAIEPWRWDTSQVQARDLYGVEHSYENALYQEWWTRTHCEITVKSGLCQRGPQSAPQSAGLWSGGSAL